MRLERIVIVALSITLVVVAIASKQMENQLNDERVHWRTMYAEAKKNIKVEKIKKCVEIDAYYSLCETP